MTIDDLTIDPVSTQEDKRTFVELPWDVYRDDANWVPPFISERLKFIDPNENPFYDHADVALFLARRDGQPVGTIAAIVNHRHNDVHDEQVGFFGLFEVLEDQEAAQALLETACDWVRQRGMTAIRGPESFSLNEEAGLLVDGREGPPVALMTYNPPYYVDFIEGAGFEKAMDLLAYMVDMYKYGPNAEHLPEKLKRVAKKIQKRGGFTVRQADMRRFDSEIELFKKVYNSAWERNWGFVPLTDAELDHMAADFKRMIDPSLIWIAEKEGDVIAALLPIPDLNQPLLKAYPRPGVPEWWTMIKFLWHWKVRGGVDTMRGFAGGVLEEYRGRGIMGVLMVQLALSSLPRYRHCEISWVLENNTMMRRAAEMLGGYVYRTYRIYEKAL